MAISDLESSFVIVDNSERLVRPSQESATVVLPSEHPSCNDSYLPGANASYAHDWSSNTTGGLATKGRHFVDKFGRVCGLRGVNLSGCSKTPVNHVHDTFPNSQFVTFVGRPFPLEEAHEHFSRLRRWGLTFIRFLITWEAVEHAGLGIYDTDYLKYIRDLLSLLPRYGIIAFVSIHQDVWSRYSGGSGAPAWTLEAVGFDLKELESTGAAWLNGIRGGGHSESERGLWPCGYHKLAAATMATCFWGGDTFAPKLTVKDCQGKSVSIQQYLQTAFLDMFAEVVKSVGDLEGVIGFEMLNEPHPGYINLTSLHSFNYNIDLHLSYIPSAFESFQLGAGHPTRVAEWTRSFPMPTKKTGHAILNPEGKSAWRIDGPTNGKCLWEMHGVWGWDRNKDEAVVLRENYFVKHPMTGKKIEFYTDFFYPFLHEWWRRVSEHCSPDKISFVEVIPNEFCPASFTPDRQLSNMVYAPHWYDLNSLFMKAFGNFTVNVQGLSRGMFPLKTFYWGQCGARDNFSLQIRNIVQNGYSSLGDVPVIIGETGVPMDMNKGEAFGTDDFTWQARMMDAILTGLERSLVGFTLWNYNPTNNDQKGDDWNGENFSWFSGGRALPASLLYYEQNAPSLDNGARILSSIVRPYPAKTAGVPVRFEYEMTTGKFTYEWMVLDEDNLGSSALKSRETEIFIPSLITRGRKLSVRGLGERDRYFHDEARQTLFLIARETGKSHKVEVSVVPPLNPLFTVNDIASDFGGAIMTVVSIGIVVVAILSVKILYP